MRSETCSIFAQERSSELDAGTEPSDDDWEICQYVYNPAGQRIGKQFDGETAVKYGAACPELAEWDGSQCIAEYDGDDNLLRKYIYGPGIDQPHSTSLRAGSSCMIKPVPDPIGDPDSGPALNLSNGAVSYYHYDGLGSVVALSDEDGDTIQVYEYDVYGNVAASDPNHTNPFMFTGRRMDTETGLYFYRARYYNPALGRFLQTDPIGYGDGMNWYAYCGNNPISCVDPSGLSVMWDYANRTWVRTPVDIFPQPNRTDVQTGWPFFFQHYEMSCIAASVLNACLVEGIAPTNVIPDELWPRLLGGQNLPFHFNETTTDLMAEDWVIRQMKYLARKDNKRYDYETLGGKLGWAVGVLGSGWRLVKERITVDDIIEKIDAGKTLIVGVPIEIRARGPRGQTITKTVYHAVTIGPTCPSLQETLPCPDWERPYNIIDPWSPNRGGSLDPKQACCSVLRQLLTDGFVGQGFRRPGQEAGGLEGFELSMCHGYLLARLSRRPVMSRRPYRDSRWRRSTPQRRTQRLDTSEEHP